MILEESVVLIGTEIQREPQIILAVGTRKGIAPILEEGKEMVEEEDTEEKGKAPLKEIETEGEGVETEILLQLNGERKILLMKEMITIAQEMIHLIEGITIQEGIIEEKVEDLGLMKMITVEVLLLNKVQTMITVTEVEEIDIPAETIIDEIVVEVAIVIGTMIVLMVNIVPKSWLPKVSLKNTNYLNGSRNVMIQIISSKEDNN